MLPYFAAATPCAFILLSKMLEDMSIRNLTENTQPSYRTTLETFPYQNHRYLASNCSEPRAKMPTSDPTAVYKQPAAM